MKQQIKRAEKNLQDALKLINEDNIEKDLLHDYIFDALKAVENLNLDDVMRYFFISFTGEGDGNIWFEATGMPSHFKIKELITNKFPQLKNPSIMSVNEMSEKDFKDFNCV